jgi:predicted permease
VQDTKNALRQLRLRPGLSFIVIVMLALGIGATTAMFSLYHQILMRPLPVPEPERLVNLATPGPKAGGTYRDLAIGDPEAQFSYPMFRDLERGQTGFTGLAGHTDFVANLSFRERPAYGRGALVSGGYFEVLNLKPALGRLIARDDEPRVGESAVVVLSHDYWQRQFGGDPNVLGERLTVNGQALEIIGVAPAGFRGTVLGTRMDVFVPLTLRWLMHPTFNGRDDENRFSYWLYSFGRLATGVTLEQAAAQLNGLYSGVLSEVEAPLLTTPQLRGATPERFRARQLAFSPGARGQSPVPATAQRPLALLLGVTVLVLLIVCVNIANLLLARGASRAGEISIRASIGATRGQLVQQLLAESLVLIAIGGALSVLVAAAIVRVISAMLPSNVNLGLDALNPAALSFAAAASLVTVLVFGLTPAWRVSGADPARIMNAHASRSSGGRGAARFRGALTTAQIAFSMVLLVLAGLFTQSLMNVSRENLGVDVDSLVSFSITPHLNAYDPARLASLYDRLEETLAAQPGVRGVGTTAIPIFYDFSLGSVFSVEGFDAPPDADRGAAWSAVGSGYFDALSVPLLAGRAFTDRDTADSPRVAIVNQAFARKFNLGDDAVGKRAAFGVTTDLFLEIVGVVADTKHASIKGEIPPLIYFPRRQMAGVFQSLWVYVRGAIDTDALSAMIPRVVAEVDPNVPIAVLETVSNRLNDNVYIDRLLSMLSAAFAGLATLLAGIGLYGVLAYNITQRTRELGLRLALGAEPERLRTMVLKQVGAMALIGAAVGLTAALGLGAAAEAVLFGLSGRDPAVFGVAAAVLAMVVFAASWLPAWRASSIAPIEALRHE